MPSTAKPARLHWAWPVITLPPIQPNPWPIHSSPTTKQMIVPSQRTAIMLPLFWHAPCSWSVNKLAVFRRASAYSTPRAEEDGVLDSVVETHHVTVSRDHALLVRRSHD